MTHGKPEDVTVSVPACFSPSQIDAVLSAAREAGWPEPRACSEPVALATALASLGVFVDEFVAMCDLGGGKFEAAVVQFGASGTFRLLSAYGEPLVGSDDLDCCVVDHVLAELSQENDLDFTSDPLARLRVLAEIRATRPQLYSDDQVELQLPFIALGAAGTPVHSRLRLTRERHDDLLSALMARVERACRKALEQAGIDRYDTRGNVMATEGHATLRAYRRAIERGFGAPKFVLKKHLIAYGAALLAGRTDQAVPTSQ
jgi:molecular chaperone DnaK (HSP70)